MLAVSGSDVSITRGDNGFLSLEIEEQDGSTYKRADGDSLTFTVKKSYSSDYAYISKEIDGLSFEILPEETSGLDYGTYWYDVELNTADGATYTVVGPSRFVIREEVTF